MQQDKAHDLAEAFIENRLKPPLLHGDAEHQAWLREELRKWIPDLAARFRECVTTR